MREKIDTKVNENSSTPCSRANLALSEAIHSSTNLSLTSPERRLLLASSKISRLDASSAPIFLTLADLARNSRSAVSITAVATTAPTSSSERIPISLAASTSSEAVCNEMDTERSLPMVDNAISVVPPAPVKSPIACFVNAHEAAAGVKERAVIFPPFLSWQQRQRVPELLLRRLVLRAPGGKRSRRDGVATLGSVFGTCLGNIVAHTKIDGAKTSTVLRRLRESLERISYLHSRMSGPDAEALAGGLAASRAITAQQKLLPELNAVKIDSKYGNAATVVGATASILCTLGMLSGSANASFLLEHKVLQTALDKAEASLSQWAEVAKLAVNGGEHNLNAERRAIRRAKIGAAAAAATSTATFPLGMLAAQLHAAARAAFPPVYVSGTTQKGLCLAIAQNALRASCAPDTHACQRCFVPLSELPACEPPTGSSSSSASSWDSVPFSDSSWESIDY